MLNLRVAPTALLLLLVASLAAPGCMPDRRDNGTDTTANGGGGGGGGDTADLDAAGGNDGVTTDGAGGTADTTGADTQPIPVGCTKDADCAGFEAPACKSVKCDVEQGVCVVSNVADGTDCGDGDPCVTQAKCAAGACIATKKVCADDNPCTTDSCLAGTGCLFANNTDGCDDGDACTDKDQCSGGVCKGQPLVCPGAKPPCLVSQCDSAKGCKVVAAEIASGATVTCDDESVCTEKDHCVDGSCKGTLKTCEDEDDGNPCTIGNCQPSDGSCVSVASGYPLLCDDGDACTVETACEGSECKGTLKSCDDGNPCTADACDKTDGCSNEPAELAQKATVTCDDGDPCTTGETCALGNCLGPATSCDDGNACTNDVCDPVSGCVAKVNLAQCNDGDPCTESDACAQGVCKGTAVSCDDGNVCTDDSCGSAGCAYVGKSNGTSCGSASQCWGAACITPECGNTSCEYNENLGNCAKDCPEGGGTCAAADEACVAQCETDLCGDEAKACDQVPGCVDLAGCVSVCDDEACRVGCLGKASPFAVKTWRTSENCLAAKCLKNSWAGKNCKLGQVSGSFPACVTACQAAVCYVELQSCHAKVGCQGIDYCVSQCADGSPSCVKACFAFGTEEEIELFDQLTLCMNLKCL